MPDFSAIMSSLTSTNGPTRAGSAGGDKPTAGLDGAFADLLAMLTTTTATAAVAAEPKAMAQSGTATTEPISDKPILPGLDQLMAMLDEAFVALRQDDELDPTIAADVGAAIDAIPTLLSPTPANPIAFPAGQGTREDTQIVVADRLSQLAGDLADLLAPLNPDLGQKLKAAAETLQAGGTLSEALAKLVTPTAEDSVAPSFTQLLNGKTAAATQLPAPPPATPEPPTPRDGDFAPPQPHSAAPGDDRPRSERASHSSKQPSPQPTPQPQMADAPAAPDPAAPQTAPPSRVETAATSPTTTHLRPYSGPPPQIDMPQLAFEIVRQAQGGNSRFEIRLDPPELGRIDVRLDIDKGGAVHARMTVDQSETLDLLQRDQRALERAMVQAGLDPAKTSLEFSLRQNPFTPDGGGRQGSETFQPATTAGTKSSDEPDVPVVSLYRGTATAGGLNLYV